MKVLFLLEDLDIGGAQRHAVDLARALRPRFDVRLLAVAPMRNPILADPEADQASSLGRRALRPSTWPVLAAEVAKIGPDVIVSVNQVATFLATGLRMTGQVRAPHVVLFHATDTLTPRGARRMTAFGAATRTARALVYVSDRQRAAWEARGLCARETLTIRNGVRLDRFAPPSAPERAAARAALGYTDTDVVIGLCAALREEKNPVQLVEAVAALRARGLPAHALFVGDGPQRGAAEAAAARLDLAQAVRITGFQPDVRPLLAAMDLGVLTSTAIETLSLAALETMATGLPMVMSETGGAAELVAEGETGFLFPVGDTTALVERLSACFDPALRRRMGAAARSHVAAHFGFERMVAAYADLFSRIGA